MAHTLILGAGFGGITVATELRRLLGEYLRREGFEVAGVEDGTQMDAWLETASMTAGGSVDPCSALR